jgi:sugar O-acyltransferase (sialic acid O-acetyltransferase NeuD family)
MDLILYGFGGFGYSVAEIAIENGYQIIGVFDEIEPSKMKIKNGKIIYLGKYDPNLYINIPLVITIGNNKVRSEISSKIKHQFITIIHKSANISPNSIIETGCIIMPNVVIHANTIVKKHSIINTSAVIDHDCEIENFVHIRPMVYIGSNSNISSFSVLEPNTFIERFSKI